nr:MAG TPA: hypothetical protein [Caudoviricetes sp.]
MEQQKYPCRIVLLQGYKKDCFIYMNQSQFSNW